MHTFQLLTMTQAMRTYLNRQICCVRMFQHQVPELLNEFPDLHLRCPFCFPILINDCHVSARSRFVKLRSHAWT